MSSATPDTPSCEAGGCTTCRLNSAQLAARAAQWWECSHVDCPQRKLVTAAPPERNGLAFEGSGCWRVKPVYLD